MTKYVKPSSDGISLKKKYGQNFLRDKKVLMDILLAIDIKNASVFEIGCGDGALPREILHQPVDRLWVFEIDPEWAEKVESECADDRLTMHVGDFLEVDLNILEQHAPWVLLANLPYHLTFPILRKLHAFRHFVPEGVIMIQEEVAQKITKTKGRGYGYVSLFYQYYFDWQLLTKIHPDSFFPAPKVFSRLLQFKTKPNVPEIPEAEKFWKFIDSCFGQPRRTLKNNLQQSHIPLALIPENLLDLRAQQLAMKDFLAVWNVIRTQL